MSTNKFLDDYKVLEVIGSGTFGKIKRAIRKSDKKVVAIKIVKKSNKFKGVMDLILKECDTLSKLEHPNVLKVYDYKSEGNYYYCVMPYYAGSDLHVFANDYTLGQSLIFTIFEQLLDAVNYLHKQNIIHRDIKLDNILLSSKDDASNIILADFGFSIFQKLDDPDLTDHPGSPLYSPPEIFEGVPYRGRAADIYQIGIVLYILLVDDFPFWSEDKPALMKMILHNYIVFPEEPPISKYYKNLLRWMLAKDPKERPTISEIKTHPGYNLLKSKYNNPADAADQII